MAFQLPIIAALVLCLIYRYIVYPAFLSPLSKLPSADPSAAVLPIWIWWQRRTGRQSRSFLAAHQRCGPIVRLAPNEISVASLEGVRKVYGGSGFMRTPWYQQFRNYDRRSNLITLHATQHAARRRMVSRLYSKSYLLGSVDFQMLSRILLFERLLPVLDDASQTGEGVDVYELACAVGVEFMSAYDVGTASGMDLTSRGRELERRLHLDNGKKKLMGLNGATKAARALEDECLEMCRNAERFLKSGTSSAPEKGERVGLEDGAPEKVGEEQSRFASTYPVVYAQLSASITAEESPRNPRETLLLVASEFLDNFEAARIGIGIALTYAMYELSRQPALQSTLREELTRLAVPFSYESDRDMFTTSTLRELDNLHLLDAVLMETLRLYPPLPGPQRRIVPKGGAVIEGHFIPGGVTISSSAYCLHMNETAYPGPNIWRPERWLGTWNGAVEDATQSENDPRRWFWVFGSGGQMCIGNNFALLVLKLLLASIFTNFTTSIVDDQGMEQLDQLVGAPVGDSNFCHSFLHAHHPEAGLGFNHEQLMVERRLAECSQF